MAVTVSTTGRTVYGNRVCLYGTFTSAAGDNTVTISHGMYQVDDFNEVLEGALDYQNPKVSHSAGVTTLVYNDTDGLSGRWKIVGQ